jgi:beta-mannosidase
MTSSFFGEFGIASFPVKESVLRYLPESEKTQWPPDTTLSLVHHTPIFGTSREMQRLTQYSGYIMPNDNLDHFITGSQLAQVVAVRHTLERARTRWPECSGALYYKMNDNYPAVSWSCVDWYGAPKPLHYFAQDAFSPVASVVLFEHTDMYGKEVSLPVFLLDDNLDLKNSAWKVCIRVFDQKLNKISSIEFSGKGTQKTVDKLGELTLSSEQTQTSPLLIVSDVFADNKLVFRTFYYMNFEKQKGSLFNLPRTSLTLTIKGNKATVKNTGKFPAVGVNLQCPGSADKFTVSDNYFWLDAGESTEVEVNITKGLASDAWNLEGNEQVNIP